MNIHGDRAQASQQHVWKLTCCHLFVVSPFGISLPYTYTSSHFVMSLFGISPSYIYTSHLSCSCLIFVADAEIFTKDSLAKIFYCRGKITHIRHDPHVPFRTLHIIFPFDMDISTIKNTLKFGHCPNYHWVVSDDMFHHLVYSFFTACWLKKLITEVAGASKSSCKSVKESAGRRLSVSAWQKLASEGKKWLDMLHKMWPECRPACPGPGPG